MKKVLFWTVFPLQAIIVLPLFGIWLIGSFLVLLSERVIEKFAWFEGWCYNMPKRGYVFDNGLWKGHWAKENGKWINKLTGEEIEK